MAVGELRTTITVSPRAAEVSREILEDQATKKQAAAGRKTLHATRRIGNGPRLTPSMAVCGRGRTAGPPGQGAAWPTRGCAALASFARWALLITDQHVPSARAPACARPRILSRLALTTD
jgi:hypothetical protein